jgi:hypothetical protein
LKVAGLPIGERGRGGALIDDRSHEVFLHHLHKERGAISVSFDVGDVLGGERLHLPALAVLEEFGEDKLTEPAVIKSLVEFEFLDGRIVGEEGSMGCQLGHEFGKVETEQFPSIHHDKSLSPASFLIKGVS